MNFIRAVQALCDASADFVIIGGWSAVLHGCAYITNDLGICFGRSRANIRRIVAALAPYHPRLRDLAAELPFIWDERTLANATVMTLWPDLGAIDLLAEVSSFEAARAHSVAVEAFERQVWTSSVAAKKLTAKEFSDGTEVGGEILRFTLVGHLFH
ncbi:MAG TPA: hypothetical protein VNH18_22335 [Bryobacteraceae bacterium]|nr:hypothetical protein [Bryobacteraceae bacterium]